MNPWPIDATHDPDRRSWVDGADDSEFPIQSLPFGVFAHGDTTRVGIAIADRVLDLTALHGTGLLDGDAAPVAEAATAGILNPVMAQSPAAIVAFRRRVADLLTAGAAEAGRVEPCLRDAADCVMRLPARIGDYTDFYASVHHATNVGSMFRPDNPLLPNYKYIPVGYHGRASSVVVDGTPVVRPVGQTKADDADAPSVGPSRLLDYELEVGVFVGPGNPHGQPVRLAEAEGHLFGICLVNDWSARDVQKWEYVPLGPFLAKSFATSVSPWVVPMHALAPYRVPAFARPDGDPAPLPYLEEPDNQTSGGIDLTLEVHLRTARMRESGEAAVRLSQGSFTNMYWTFAQMLTHHTMNGCNLRPGDLMASGTVSGPDKDSRGSLLELSWRGTEPIQLPNGEERRFLQDGDEVILRGWCEREGRARIGLGSCSGVVEAARGGDA